MQELIAKLQDAIFQNPGPATGIGGWQPYKDTMRTSLRPDGTPSRRKDKTILERMTNGSLYLHYNGASFQSCGLWAFLRQRYNTQDNKHIIETLCAEYGIPFDQASNHMNTTTHKRIITIGDESQVCTIPEDIVERSINLHREDALRFYLNGILDPLVLECAWDLYRIGITNDNQPIFWVHDRNGRCRTGKIMRYTNDGHRDKKTSGSIIAVPFLLKKSGMLSEGWEHVDALFGEHLIDIFPDQTIGLVESEKTALVAAVVFPKYIWLATGGATRNLDRAIGILAGRKVTVFPDADAHEIWFNRFNSVPGWKVSDIARQKAQECGPEWSKCDLADILIQQAIQKRTSLKIA